MDISADEELAKAKNFVGKMLGNSTQLLARIKPFMQDLANADLNNDKVLTGAELAAVVMVSENLFPDFDKKNFQKYGCKQENEMAEQEVVDVMNYNVGRRHHVLKNKSIGYKAEDIIKRSLKNFSDSLDIRTEQLDPKTKSYIDSAIEQWSLVFDGVMIKTYEDLKDKGEIGDLPSKITPMTLKDLCAAAQMI